MSTLLRAFADGLRPPEQLDLADWSKQHIRLSPEDSSAPGQFTPWPFQIEPMSVMSPRHPAEKVVVLTASQMMKTRLMLNFLAYVIAVDPGPVLFVEPRAQDAEALSKDRVSPMLRDTPILRGKISEAKSRESGNTIEHKKFRGGHVSFGTATSPSSLAMRPIRYLFLDEISRREYQTSAEGDPVRIAEKRTATFWNRKIIYASSPSDEGVCRISDVYAHSDQREWQVPCPFCNHYQPIAWPNIVWSREGKPVSYVAAGGVQSQRIVPASSPMLRCAGCGNLIDEKHKPEMNARGRYVARNENGLYPGFTVTQLASPIRSWADIVQEWIECQGKPEQLKVFVNTVLAETWKEAGADVPQWEKLLVRRESYSSDVLPAGVLLLTAGVDVQSDRIEASLWGWGRRRQRWLIEHRVFYGSPNVDATWDQLAAWKAGTWHHANGSSLAIARTAVDAGHETNRVYQWVREQPDVIAVDGRDSLSGVVVGTPTFVDVTLAGKKLRRGMRLWPVDASKLKSELYGLLHLARQSGDEYPNGWVHLSRDVDEEWLRQLTAEQQIRRIKNGYDKLEWRKMRERNEALDCAIYARAAANQIGWDRMQERQFVAIETSLTPDAASDTAGARVADSPRADVAKNPAEPSMAKAQASQAPAPATQERRARKPIQSSWI